MNKAKSRNTKKNAVLISSNFFDLPEASQNKLRQIMSEELLLLVDTETIDNQENEKLLT